MTRIIRSGDAGLAMPVRLARPSPKAAAVSAPPDPMAGLTAEIANLKAALAAHEETAARHPGAVEQAYREGEQAGQASALEQRSDFEAQALERLDQGLAKSLAAYRDEIAQLERLAGLLAREALRKVLGDSAGYVSQMDAVIHAQLANLEADAILRVQVSAADFPHSEAITALADKVASPGLVIETSEGLEPGDCRFVLRLGSVEVGQRAQWGRLEALLQSLAEAHR